MDIFAQFQLFPESCDYKDYFVPQRNIMFERFKFNSDVQQKGELVVSFVTDVRTMADLCNFGTFKNELIRDRIVVRMIDAKPGRNSKETDLRTLNLILFTAPKLKVRNT